MDNRYYMTLEQVQDVLSNIQNRPSTPKRLPVNSELKLTCFSEYINVQWPTRGPNSNPSGASSSNCGSLDRPGGCPEPRKPSIDQGSLGGGIGPGLNEDEKLRNFVETSIDVSKPRASFNIQIITFLKGNRAIFPFNSNSFNTRNCKIS